MGDFLVTVTAYTKHDGDTPMHYSDLREKMASLGLRDYLVNDANEWIALPENVYAEWLSGPDSDTVIEQMRLKIASLWGGQNSRGVFFVTVGSDAVSLSQLFE